MKIPVRAIMLFLLLILGVSHAHAERRLALVIGNGSYSDIGRLPNPPADARLISQTLQEVGFETTLILNSNQFEMKSKIANFGRALRNADKNTVGFFYYAGHGVQAQGRNYLLPVEAAPNDQADLDLMGVEANWVLRQMESAGNRTNIVVLDACRNNPFVAANRSLGRGLAQIDAPTGSFISYATAPGKVALDGDSDNSPFTTALAKALPTAGMAIEQIFKQVRVNVIRATNGAQTPWDSSSLVDDFYVLPEPKNPESTPTAVVPAQSANNSATPEEISLWQSVRRTADPARIALFLQVYPTSSIAPEARALLANLMAGHPTDEDKQTTTPEITIANAGNKYSTTNTGTAAADATTETTVMAQVAETPKPKEAETVVEVPKPPEDELIATAQETRSIEDYQRYVDAYPKGLFVEFAKAEIAHLNSQLAAAKTDSASAKELPATTAETTSAAADKPSQVLLFDQPVPGDEESRSFAQIVKGSPAYSPIEGLGEEYWAKQECSNCHSWTRADLCKQGEFYVGKEDSAIERIKHPLGGYFKKALKAWAGNGCQ